MNQCSICFTQISSAASYCRSCYRRVANSDRQGENHPNWRGGRQVSDQGYVFIKVNGKVVREHRYIMEQFIGRKLLPEETVHHINGVKTDNRIENLELWASVHPKGQRIQDLVLYAKEILARYSDLC